MNVLRDQVSGTLRRVLDAPPPVATQSYSAVSVQQQQQPCLPPLPVAPLRTGGNLNVTNDHKAKFGAKEFVTFDENEFPTDSASCNNVTKAACGASGGKPGSVRSDFYLQRP